MWARPRLREAQKPNHSTQQGPRNEGLCVGPSAEEWRKEVRGTFYKLLRKSCRARSPGCPHEGLCGFRQVTQGLCTL